MKYRKRPIVIEAVQFIPGEVINVEWIRKAINNGTLTMGDDEVSILTLEGIMEAKPRDYIIQGIKGELYPCDEEIFLATYEEVK